MPDMSIRGRFVWHELMTNDPVAAAAFYAKVIGWKTMKWDQDPSYSMFAYQGVPMAGLMKVPAGPSWMTYVGTPDIHVTAWEAQRLGGKLHKGPQSTPTVGTWAILQDPQGASFAAHTPENMPKLVDEPGIGDFSWHELATADHRAAFAFYRDLFGWEKTDSMDMGEAGEYLMYGWGKRPLGGMYTKGKDMPGPAAWTAYICVADVPKTTKAIVAAGGRVINGPMEVPGGDWITMATDPQGAMFAIHARAKKAPAKPKAPAKKKPAKKAAAKKPARKKAAKKKAAKNKSSKKARTGKTKRRK